MKNWLKLGLLLTVLFAGQSLLAQSNQRLGLKLGMEAGGLAVGADYIIQDTDLESYQVYLTVHNKDEDDFAPGILAAGGALRLQTLMGPYELYIAPGVGFIQRDFVDNELLIGPRVAFGVSLKVDQYLALGFENEKLYSLFGDIQGNITDSFTFTAQYYL